MRRLLVFVCAVILVDTALYAALAPLLPVLRDELALSKPDAGLLFSVYGVGMFLAAIPAGWLVARRGPRVVLIGGLLVMVGSTAVFALAHAVALLDVARFGQGLAGAASWTAGLAWLARETPEGRRGRVIGVAIGMGIVGVQVGPVLGAIARAAGRDVTFLVLAGVALVLLLWGLTMPHAGTPEPRGATIRAALADRPLRRAGWLTLIGALAIGAVDLLVPLRLDDLGAGGLAISGAFLVAATAEAAANPLAGRYVDRHGAGRLVPLSLLGAAVVLVALALPGAWVPVAVLLVLVAAAIGVLWTPGGNFMSIAADRVGLDQGYAFALSNMGWSAGIAVGSAAGGALADGLGDWATYVLVAAGMLATVPLWLPGRRDASLPSAP